ncbi:acyl carrier protein [Nocardia ninae]|uniref:Carrier domain-containing protein n=1 Tax=Nocardia ninae NBRC 108245 TaxID=1210091 RepID=A0A511MDQ9_9NOCA|nr:acyl carrier protein [Nocardia ninae]GEM38783.1 hypothetical protein NN4_33020 [Nocardia ninae NBRC 108245]
MTQSTEIDADIRDAMVDIVAGVLELDAAEISWNGDFREDYDADSLQGIQILAALERRFGIIISPERLPEMVTLASTYALVLEALAEAGGGNGAR